MESQQEPHLIGYKKKVPPSPQACKLSEWENHAKTASAEKRKTELYISDYFGKFLLYIHNKSFRHLTVCFFTHTDWFYAVNPFCSSLNCCFRLQITVHRLAVLLTVFWRKKRAKSVSAEKWKSEECRSYLFCVSMKLQFHNTWITLAKKVKNCGSFFLALESRFAPLQIFSCACKLNLRLQSSVHLHNSYPSHANLLGIKAGHTLCDFCAISVRFQQGINSHCTRRSHAM